MLVYYCYHYYYFYYYHYYDCYYDIDFISITIIITHYLFIIFHYYYYYYYHYYYYCCCSSDFFSMMDNFLLKMSISLSLSNPIHISPEFLHLTFYTDIPLISFSIIKYFTIFFLLSRHTSNENKNNRKEENERISVFFDKPKTTFDSINSDLRSTYEERNPPVTNILRSSMDRNSRSSMQYGLPIDRDEDEDRNNDDNYDENENEHSGLSLGAKSGDNALETGGWGTIESQAFRLVQYSTVQYSTVQYSTVQYSTVQYSTVQYSTVQCSTVQYSTVWYSTVQYSIVLYCIVLYCIVLYCIVLYCIVM